MVVDKRHDHSFRVPRPDLSDKLQTSNACTDCHKDKPASWAAAGDRGLVRASSGRACKTYGEAFHAAWHDEPGAAVLLAAVAADANAPSFARAGALAGLAPYVSPANVGLARKGLQDPDPMVRIAALDMLDGVPPDQLWPVVAPLLSDPIRGVRLRAVSLLAGMPTDRLSAPDRDTLDRAMQSSSRRRR